MATGLLWVGVLIFVIGIVMFFIGIYLLNKEMGEYHKQTQAPYSSKTTAGWVVLILGIVFTLSGIMLVILSRRKKTVKIQEVKTEKKVEASPKVEEKKIV